MKQIIIAVDGYAATGKSTTAKRVADLLDYTFIDTGAMYRAVAYYFRTKGIPFEQGNPAVGAAMDSMRLEFRLNEATGQRDMWLNGENVELAIRSMEVSESASLVSTLGIVREKLVAMQQEMGRKGGVVMDGRDIGTVVFPQAELKVFLTANMDIRVQRRIGQLARKGKDVDAATVEADLRQRDHRDSTRDHSPLRMAEDAIEIDTSNYTIEEQADLVVKMAMERMGAEAGA